MAPVYPDVWKVALSIRLLYDRDAVDIRVPDGPAADLDSPPLI